MPKIKRIKFTRTKLGKQKLWGDADEYPILIDDRLKGKKELEIMIHESFHYLFPAMDEIEVITKSIILTNTLWYEGFRKVDNSNDIPLQDGTK
jgi:hypothetical protein